MTTRSADGDVQERQHTSGFQFKGELDVGVLAVEEFQEKGDMGLLSEQQETVINVAFVQDRFELNERGIQPYSFKMT